MNRMMIRGKLRQARGGLKAEWGRLTEDDRRMLDGKIDQLVGLFQERYGYTQERAAAALEHYLGGRAKKPAKPAVTVIGSPLVVSSVIGFAIVAVAGWFTFTQLFSGSQPAIFEPDHDDPIGFADELFAPADLEASRPGY